MSSWAPFQFNLWRLDMTVGFRVLPRSRKVGGDVVERFRSLPVANVSDGMSRMTAGGSSLRPMHGGGVLAGPAVTVKSRPGDNLMVHKALDLASRAMWSSSTRRRFDERHHRRTDDRVRKRKKALPASSSMARSVTRHPSAPAVFRCSRLASPIADLTKTGRARSTCRLP